MMQNPNSLVDMLKKAETVQKSPDIMGPTRAQIVGPDTEGGTPPPEAPRAAGAPPSPGRPNFQLRTPNPNTPSYQEIVDNEQPTARAQAWDQAANKGPAPPSYQGPHLNGNRQWAVTDGDGQEHVFRSHDEAVAAAPGMTAHTTAAGQRLLGPQPAAQQPQDMSITRGGVTTQYDAQGHPTMLSGAGFGRQPQQQRGRQQGPYDPTGENLRHQHRMDEIAAQHGPKAGRGSVRYTPDGRAWTKVNGNIVPATGH
jgi:hypothetical protein